MDRPKGFAAQRFIGDKRTQTVYDLDDDATPVEAIEDLMAAESGLAFGPDSLAEARNRGYRLWKGSRYGVTTVLEHHFSVDGITLAAHLARPSGSAAQRPGVVVCHGFPSGHGSGPKSAHTYPQLADRIAEDIDAVVLAFNFRGCRPSEGMFSMDGWGNDVRAAVDHVGRLPGVNGVAIVGFGTGGALAICAGAADARVSAVATLGAPADFSGWASAPRQLLGRARELGILGGREPESFDLWARGLREVKPVSCAEALAPRPLLVMHGADDDLVPALDARALADGHSRAELKIMAGASHQLRHDPRAVAVLLGWLDRQRTSIQGGAMAGREE